MKTLVVVPPIALITILCEKKKKYSGFDITTPRLMSLNSAMNLKHDRFVINNIVNKLQFLDFLSIQHEKLEI